MTAQTNDSNAKMKLEIVSFTSDPSDEQPVKWASKVNLSWTTRGADSSRLVDADTLEEYVAEEGDGSHRIRVLMTEGTPDRRFAVFAKQGAQTERKDITLVIRYPRLEFIKPLTLEPSVGVTNEIQDERFGSTILTGTLAPVTDVRLTWAINFREIMEKYVLVIDGDNDHPIDLPPDAERPYQLLPAQLPEGGIKTTTRFLLKAIARFDERSELEAESEATLNLYPPIDNLTLSVSPAVTTQVIETEHDLLLYNEEFDCECVLQVSPDPRSQGSPEAGWTFFPDGDRQNGVECRNSELEVPASFGLSFDVVPGLHARGRGGDTAEFLFERRVRSIDKFLEGRAFFFTEPTEVRTTHLEHPINVNPFHIVVGENLTLHFVGDSQSIVVNYAHRFTTGMFNQNQHNWPEPCEMGIPTLGPAQMVWPHYAEASGYVPILSHGSGVQSFTLRIYFRAEPEVKICFLGNETWYDLCEHMSVEEGLAHHGEQSEHHH